MIWSLALLMVLVVAGVAAAVWWRWDTARQPVVTDAVPVMRQAVAATVIAAGPDAAVASNCQYLWMGFRATCC